MEEKDILEKMKEDFPEYNLVYTVDEKTGDTMITVEKKKPENIK
jgi:hypothetical protein